jgi:Cu/Ag efflux pump CusA
VAAIGAAGVAAWRLASRQPPPIVVEIVASSRGVDATELERSVTQPIERAASGAPRVALVESVTVEGSSVVRVVFSPEVGLFESRAEVLERLSKADLPPGVMPVLSRARSSKKLTYALVPDPSTDLAALRTFQDWELERALEGIPGVADVSACGGRERRAVVTLDPARLRAAGIVGDGVVAAFHRVGLAFPPGLGGFTRLEDIGPTVVAAHNGVPVRVADVGTVAIDAALPECIARRADREIVVGEVMLLPGVNMAEVTPKVTARLREVEGLARVELLEMEARAPFVHARVGLASGSVKDQRGALVAAAASSPDVTDVLVRETGDEIELVARVRSARVAGDAAQAIARAVEKIPGARYDMTSPAGIPRELRLARARLRGADYGSLCETAEKAVGVLAELPDLHGVSAPDTARVPRLRVEGNRAQLAARGVREGDLEQTVRLATVGEIITSRLADGARSVDIVVRMPQVSPELLQSLDVTDQHGALVPLPSVARIAFDTTPGRIARASGQRYVDVLFDASSDRTLEAAKKQLASRLALPAGVSLEVGRAPD